VKTLVFLVLAIEAEVSAAGPPLGLDLYMPVPESNQLTTTSRIGEALVFDKLLSCAGCRGPKPAFSDGRAIALIVGGTNGT